MSENSILLVDDEADIREVLGLALADLGYEVHRAADAKEALEIFHEKKPPIVFTDIKMPGMDGIDLLTRIKRESPDTEVVMITGHGDMNLAIKSFRENATDFITKPVNVEGLEKTLKQVREKMEIKERMADYTRNLESLLFDKTLRLREVEGESGDRSVEGAPPLGTIVDRLPCFVMILDRGLRIVIMNRRLRESFGHQTGRRCHKVFRDLEKPCPDCPAEKAYATGKSFQAESELRGNGDEPVKVMAWATPVQGTDGGVEAVMVMATRLSEIQELHDHLASLGLMVGSMSHGIKGLLTGLDGGLFVVNSGLEKDDRQRVAEGVEMVRETSRRIRKLIFDVLFYAKERDLDLETVSVVDFFNDVAGVAENRMREAGVEFVRACGDECEGTRVEIDQGFMSAALINILENAADACGGCEEGKTGRVVFSLSRDNGRAVFRVEDNGVGMDEETRQKLFTMFFSTKGHKGTGLGLFVANKVISQHGGDLDVDSSPGRGTTVTARIPVVNGARSQ
ncbi:MAG: response regulator [Desulfatibacillaceae bacterium]